MSQQPRTPNEASHHDGGPARPARRIGRSASLAVVGVAAALGLVALPSTGTTQAYNSGVKSLTLTPAADTCIAGQPLPCAPGAAVGDANVLRVTQSEVSGYHQFNGLTGTSLDADSIWLSVDFGAECRVAHNMTAAFVDTLVHDASEGVVPFDSSGLGPDAPGGWPWSFPLPGGRTMPVERRALHMPIEMAFHEGLIDSFPTKQDVFDAGEAVIAQRIADGMTGSEARAIDYELNTWLVVAGHVECDLPGLAKPRYKRVVTQIPLTIMYEPVTVAPTVPGGHGTAGDLALPQVTQAQLSVLPDPADPCTLHLSGVITTNMATDIEYRWVNQYGQPSNTYQLHVDHTLVGFVNTSIPVPHAETPDNGGNLAPAPGGGGIGGKVAEGVDETFSGTFELEVVSPNVVADVDGFNVPYCTAPAPVRVNPGFDDAAGGLTRAPSSTHG